MSQSPLSSAQALQAEGLYLKLLDGVRALVADSAGPVVLAGIPSGGAWLAERLHRDLGLSGAPGVVSSSMHRDDFAQRGLADGGRWGRAAGSPELAGALRMGPDGVLGVPRRRDGRRSMSARGGASVAVVN